MVMFEKNVTVDMSAENNYNCVRVKEGDYNSRYLNVVILADGAKFVFQDGDIVSLRCLHENDTFDITFGKFNDDSSVLIEIPRTIISQYGTATCDIAITRDSDSLLSSSCITLEIVKSPVGKTIDTDDGPKSPSELWSIIEAAVGPTHSHNNLNALNRITGAHVDSVGVSEKMRHVHSNKGVLDLLDSDDNDNLTFKGKPISSSGAEERPTDVYIFEDLLGGTKLDYPTTGCFAIFDSWGMCDIPYGTEIKSIEILIEDEDWTDINEMYEKDRVPYHVNMKKVFECENEKCFALASPLLSGITNTNYIYNAIMLYGSGQIKITYYTDNIEL